MSRKLLIGISIAGHAGLFAGVFVSSAWDLEQLTPERRSRAALAVMTPPRAESAAPSARKPEAVTPKQRKQVVREARQPAPRLRDQLVLTTEPPGDGTGAPGAGTGLDRDGLLGGDACDEANGPCAPALPALPLPELPPAPPPPPEPRSVTPEILRGLRIRGETAIYPPREVHDEMYRSGNHRASATLLVCLTEAGTVASVAVKKSTSYHAYDAKLVEAARGWVYRPYTVNGAPVPACGVVTFQYAMK